MIYLPENKGKDSVEPDDFDADSKDEDVFENIIPDADPVGSIDNSINQQYVADLLINAETPSSG